jgi:hypothetical protein
MNDWLGLVCTLTAILLGWACHHFRKLFEDDA